jgi:hypothetical protein
MKFLKAVKRVGGSDTDIEIPYSEDGGSQPILIAPNVAVSSAEILSGFADGPQLIAEQGVDTVIVPVFVTMRYVYGTTAYSTSGTSPIWAVVTGPANDPTGQGVFTFSPDAVFTGATEDYFLLPNVGDRSNQSGQNAPGGNFNNQPLKLITSSGDPLVDGDGSLLLTVAYYVQMLV